jgi:chromosome segregation protein
LHLKKLEIQGFKSFADRINLEFVTGITSIVGPNGSGKSNISDAVRWVLGEQSLKSLRGSRMEDVIFSGTEHRKPSGLAEVTLVIDNRDGRLPLEYAEVSVARRAYRSGESEYLINKNHCRLKDIYEMFFDTGIGREGYTIIGQGKVDEILNNKPEERRGIFEEAAGIMKYKVRKLEAERKLEATERNLARIGDIVAELSAQLDILREQAAAARKYLALGERLKRIELEVYTSRIGRCLAELKKGEDGAGLAREELARAEAAMARAEAASAEKGRRGEAIDAAHDELRDALLRIESQLVSAGGAITLSREKSERSAESARRLRAEISEAGERNERRLAELASNEDKAAYIAGELGRLEARQGEKKSAYAELLSSLGAHEREMEALKQEAAALQESHYEKRSAFAALSAELEHFAKNRLSIGRSMEAAAGELERDAAAMAELGEAKKAAGERLEALRGELARRAGERADKSRRIEALSAAAQAKLTEKNAKKARARILSDLESSMEGFHASVKRVLSRCRADAAFGEGIYGAVAALIEVPREYVAAIGTALGQAQQNIVAADEDAAKRAIEYLKRTSGGRATFMPLTSVKGGRLERGLLARLAGQPGYVGLARDLVRCDALYDPAITQLLGRTCIVDAIGNAVRLAREFRYSFRIVTLEGDVLATGGTITGGSVEVRDSGILSRHAEIPELNAAIAALDAELAGMERERAALAAGLEAATREAEAAERERNALNVESASLDGRISGIGERMKVASGRIELYEREKREAEAHEKELAGAIEAAASEADALLAAMGEKNAELAKLGERSREGQQATDALREDISGLSVSIASMSEARKAVLANIGRIKSEMQSDGAGAESKLAEIERLEEDIRRLALESAASEAERRKLGTEKQGRNLQLESIAAEKAALREEMSQAAEDIAALAERIAGIQREIGRQEAREARIGAELESSRNRLWDEYELTYHNALELLAAQPGGAAAGAVPELGAGVAAAGPGSAAAADAGEAAGAGGEAEAPELAGAPGPGETEGTGSAGRTAAAIKEEIKALGFVNVLAIDEYAATKARHEKMQNARQDMEEAGAKLRKVIGEMSAIMQQTFQEQFELINANFNAVFQELFEGGQGRLVLTEGKKVLEAGVEIEIQFPGKKMQNMMLYSGGERAMTAIALIFAMLKLKPAPFCLLDEIESALDEANVDRFARYLASYCASTQFIMVTHRKGTMEASNALYGVTMQEKGVSSVVSLRLAGERLA